MSAPNRNVTSFPSIEMSYFKDREEVGWNGNDKNKGNLAIGMSSLLLIGTEGDISTEQGCDISTGVLHIHSPALQSQKPPDSLSHCGSPPFLEKGPRVLITLGMATTFSLGISKITTLFHGEPVISRYRTH